MAAKTKLEDILPSIKDYFVGKPVQTEQGQGFILSMPHDKEELRVQFEKGKDTQLISREKLIEDKDEDEFHYDEKDMLEIETQKKERSQEKNKAIANAAGGGYVHKKRACCTFTLGYAND